MYFNMFYLTFLEDTNNLYFEWEFILLYLLSECQVH